MSATDLAHQADLANYIPTDLGQAAKGAIPVYVGNGLGYKGSNWAIVQPSTDLWALFSSSMQAVGTSYSPGAYGGGIVDGSVDRTHRKITAQPRSIAWAPTGAIFETFSRNQRALATTILSSGQMSLFGGGVARRGKAVSNVVFPAASTAGAMTNQWACLVDQAGNVLAKSTDLGAAAWASGADHVFPLSSPYTPTADIAVYLGLVVVGAPPQLFGDSGSSSFASDAPYPVALGGTGYTDPASLGATVALTPATFASGYGYAT